MEDQQPHRSRHDPTLAQCIGGDRANPGVPLSAALVSQVVSEIASELDDLHNQGRTHGDVRAARIAVPAVGPAYLLEPERRAAPARTQDDGDVVLYPLDTKIDEDVIGLVTAAYFALTATPPEHLFPLSLSGGTSRQPDAPFPGRPGRPRPGPPSGVFDVLAKGLGQPRGNRYAAAGAFAEALEAAASPPGSTADALRTPFLRPLSPLPAWTRLVPAGAALLALGVWLGHRQTPVPELMATTPPPAFRSADALTDDSSRALPVMPWHRRLPATADRAIPTNPSQAKPPRKQAVSEAPPTPVWPLPNLTNPWAAPSTVPDAEDSVTRPASLPHPFHTRRFRPAPALLTRQNAVSRGQSADTRCYLLVYARQFLSKEDLLANRPQVVRPQRVLVDGNPSTSLASGRWTPLAPGVHMLAFYPAHGGPFDANANFRIRLTPGRQTCQIPLPRHPHDGQPADLAASRPIPSAQEQEGRPDTAPESEHRGRFSQGTGGNQPAVVDVSSVSSPKATVGRRTGL